MSNQVDARNEICMHSAIKDKFEQRNLPDHDSHSTKHFVCQKFTICAPFSIYKTQIIKAYRNHLGKVLAFCQWQSKKLFNNEY